MVNFGYPYNELVICKDSTDYLSIKLPIVGQLTPGATRMGAPKNFFKFIYWEI